MQLEIPTATDRRWLEMRVRLWPDSEAAHLLGMADAIARDQFIRLAVGENGSPIGFVEASKRTDYVNGAKSSPVAFLEGIYVETASRGQGVARALVVEVETWARTDGCVELASDALLENEVSHAFHRALGFDETERVVCFCRALRGA